MGGGDMKRRFAGLIAIILTLFVFPYAYANLGSRQAETLDDPNSPAYSIHLKKVPTGSSEKPEIIQIRYNNMPLKSVLQNISDETGVVFNVANVLLEKEVNANITSKSWESAVNTLLMKYSRVEVWNADTDTSRVWLLESGDAKSAKLKEKPKPRTAGNQPVRDNNPPVPVPVPMANTFGGGIENLPPHILMEPSVIAYFEKAGVEIPASVRKMSPPLPKGFEAGKIPAYILNDPMFMGFLGAKGLPRPIG
jgi:hypothetical protein